MEEFLDRMVLPQLQLTQASAPPRLCHLMKNPRLAPATVYDTSIPQVPTPPKEPEIQIKQEEKEGEIPPLYAVSQIPKGWKKSEQSSSGLRLLEPVTPQKQVHSPSYHVKSPTPKSFHLPTSPRPKTPAPRQKKKSLYHLARDARCAEQWQR